MSSPSTPTIVKQARRSAVVLVLGLSICVPTVAYWGSKVQIHPVLKVDVLEDGGWEIRSSARWRLPLDQVEHFRIDGGAWQRMDLWKERDLQPFEDATVELKWSSRSLWTLIRLELLP